MQALKLRVGDGTLDGRRATRLAAAGEAGVDHGAVVRAVAVSAAI